MSPFHPEALPRVQIPTEHDFKLRILVCRQTVAIGGHVDGADVLGRRPCAHDDAQLQAAERRHRHIERSLQAGPENLQKGCR